jgi:NitT/TauT family transport system substrate-binding protein
MDGAARDHALSFDVERRQPDGRRNHNEMKKQERKMGIRRLKVAYAALTVLAATAMPAAAQAPRKVTVITDLLNMVYTPLYVGITNGIFAKHGLEINLTTLQSGSNIAAVIQSGSVDLAASGSLTQLLAVKNGAKFTAIAAEGTPSLELCARPAWMAEKKLTESSSVSEIFTAFKGARVGVTGVATTPDLVGKFLIATYGNMDPARDVTTVTLGSNAAISTAFQQGAIDVNLSGAPACENLADAGIAKVLLRPDKVPAFGDVPYAVIYGQSSWIEANPAVAKAFAAAIAETIALCHATPNVCIAVLQKYFPSTKPETLNDAFHNVILKTMPKTPRMTADGWARADKILTPVNPKPVDTSEAGGLWTNKYLP